MLIQWIALKKLLFFTLGSIYSTNAIVGLRKFLKQTIQIELNRVKNPSRPEANQLVIYKCG